AGQVDGPILCEQRLQFDERVVGVGPSGGFGFEGVEDANLAAPGFESEERLGAEEAEAADLLAADDALEEEREGRSLDLAERRDGREAIAGQLTVDRDARCLADSPGEVLERGAMDGHGVGPR